MSAQSTIAKQRALMKSVSTAELVRVAIDTTERLQGGPNAVVRKAVRELSREELERYALDITKAAMAKDDPLGIAGALARPRDNGSTTGQGLTVGARDITREVLASATQDAAIQKKAGDLTSAEEAALRKRFDPSTPDLEGDINARIQKRRAEQFPNGGK